MANPGLVRQTTLEAATEGVQVLDKVFEREIMRDAGQLGWFVDVTNDTFPFARADRDFKGFVFGDGGASNFDAGIKRLGVELYGFRNFPADDDQTDFRVRELQASRIPHANVIAWGATGDGTTDDRSAISDAITELKTAGGGELFFPPGTFRMSTGISETDLKGITIRGAGVTTSTLKLDDVAARHFAFTAAEGITFKDLTFQGAGSTTASNAGGGVNMPLGSKTFNEGHRFENVQFLEMSETAIEIPTSRGLVISNVKIEDNALDMVDLTNPQATHIESLLMVNGQQRGLFIHGGGKDVGVYASRALQCGIGYEVDAAAVVFSGSTAEDGQNRSASFPGYGFVAGDTLSLVTLLNSCVISTAGITADVETGGAEFAKLNYRTVLAGVTTTESIAGGGSIFPSGIETNLIESFFASRHTIPDTPLQIVGYAGGASANHAVRIDGSMEPGDNQSAFGVNLQSAITESGAGTHALFATAVVGAPVIVGGAAALTSVAALYLPDTTTGGATNNWSIYAPGTSASHLGGDLRVEGDLTLTGLGPHAIGGTPSANVGLRLTGVMGITAASDFASGFYMDATVTGFEGATNTILGAQWAPTLITQGALETINVVAGTGFDIPSITLTAGDTITIATTVVIEGAPTEGLLNFALLVIADDVVFGGQLAVGGLGGPTAQVHFVSQSATSKALIVSSAASPTEPVAEFQVNGTVRWLFDERDSTGQMIQLGGYDIGTNTGRRIFIGENSNGSTPAAGHIIFRDLSSGSNYFWIDDSGDARVGTTAPTFSNDLSGTVVGAQTSWHERKTNIEPWDDGQWAVDRIMATDLHTFQFKDCGMRAQKEMHGYVIHDRDAWYAMNAAANQMPALDEAEILGTLTAVVKHLIADVAELKKGRVN